MTIEITSNIYSNQPNVPIIKDAQTPNVPRFIPSLKDLTFLAAAKLRRINNIPPALIASSVESLGLSHLFHGYNKNPHSIPEDIALGFSQFATEYCNVKDKPTYYSNAKMVRDFMQGAEDKKVYLSALVQGLQNSSMIPNDYQMRQLLTHMIDPDISRLVQNAVHLWIGYLLKNMEQLNSVSTESNDGAIAVNGLKSFLSLLGVGKEDVVQLNANWIVQNATTWSHIFSKGLKLPKNIKMFNGLNILQVALIMKKTELANTILEIGGYESCKITKVLKLYHTSPVNLATLIGSFDLTKKIMDINAKNNNSLKDILKKRFTCPLHIAASTGNEKIMEKLLTLEIDVNAKGVNDVTPLYLAVSHRNYSAAKLLLKNKASAKPGAPYKIALKNDDYELLELLYKFGGVPKTISKYFNDYAEALTIPHIGRLKILEKYNLVPPNMEYLNNLNLSWAPITDSNKQMFIDLIELLETHKFDCFDIALSNEQYEFYELLLEQGRILSQDTVNRVFSKVMDSKIPPATRNLLHLKNLIELNFKPDEELYFKLSACVERALNDQCFIYNENDKMKLIQAAAWLKNHVVNRKRSQPDQVNTEQFAGDTNNRPNKKQKLN